MGRRTRALRLGVAMAAVIVTADRFDAMDLQEPANPTARPFDNWMRR